MISPPGRRIASGHHVCSVLQPIGSSVRPGTGGPFRGYTKHHAMLCRSPNVGFAPKRSFLHSMPTSALLASQQVGSVELRRNVRDFTIPHPPDESKSVDHLRAGAVGVSLHPQSTTLMRVAWQANDALSLPVAQCSVVPALHPSIGRWRSIESPDLRTSCYGAPMRNNPSRHVEPRGFVLIAIFPITQESSCLRP
jgi:hypothetical protein